MSGLTLEKLDPQFEAGPTGLTLEKLGVSLVEPESFVPEIEEQQAGEDIGPLDAAGRGLVHGVIGVGESLATGMEYLGGKTGSESLAAGGEIVGDYLREKAKPFEAPAEIQGNILDNKGLMAKGSWWTYHLADMAPSFGAMMIPSVVAGKAISALGKGRKAIQIAGKTLELTPKVIERLAKIGSMTVAGITGGGMEGSSTYQEILKRGGSREDAEAGLEAMTLAAGALNSIGFGKITGKLGAKKTGALMRFLKGGSWEGLTEYLEEPAEVLIKRGILPEVAFSKNEAIEQLKSGVNVIPIAGVMGGGASVAFNRVSPEEIKESVEGALTDDQTYSQNRDQFVEQLSKGFADGTVSIEDVMEAKAQHEEGENPDPKVISAFNSIISNYEETTGPVEGTELEQEALTALENFKDGVSGLDARIALETKDRFVKRYPWLEDQANEAIIDAQVYAGARKRVGLLTPEEQAEREYGAYGPGMPGEVEPAPIKPEVEPGPTSIFELQEGVKRRQAETVAKERELALQRPGLPPGQGFEIIEPKPETRLRPSPEKIEGPTYPEGVEYVAGKEAPEGLGVEHKPVLTAKRPAESKLDLTKRYVEETGEKIEEGELDKVKEKYPQEWERFDKEEKHKKELWDQLPESFRRNRGINEYTTEDLKGMVEETDKEAKLKKVSKKVKAETPGMLKEYSSKAEAEKALSESKKLVSEGIIAKTHEVVPYKEDFEIVPKTAPHIKAEMAKVSQKIQTETSKLLKESDKVNDVTLGTLVKHATEDPAKALEHAKDATVSKAKLIEGLKNKGPKAMGEAKTKEERAEIAKNLEETLLGIEEGKKPLSQKVESGIKKIERLDAKRRDYIEKYELIISTSGVGQAPPVAGVALDKAAAISKKQAKLWNDIRSHIVFDGKTLWQVAVADKKTIVKTTGEEEGLDFYGSDIRKMIDRAKKPKEPVAKAPAKEPLTEIKSRLLENIKAEKGSSELINDLSRLGADAIKRGHTSFKTFSAEMKTVLSDAWAKVKHLMREAYGAAKKILKSERGAIDLGKGKPEPKKDLPAFMQNFLAKAKTEPAPEFGSAKATPPPIGSKADPKKVNSWLADNTDSATKSIVHYLNMDLNVLEQVMASPEYYQHPVMKKIVRFFTRIRPETYHHYFNHLNDTELSRDNDVVQQLKDLKGKGISWGRRQIGSTSEEYKIFKKMTDTVDIEWKKNPKDSMEEHLNKIEKVWRARGATDDVIAAYRAQRGAYERGLALQRRQMEELLDKMVKKKASKISKIAFGKKESTKRFGKQYLEKPDLFSSFRTVTHKTAEKWDLPSTEGIMYVIGTYEKGGGQGVQSVNFDKNVFDETTATDWWNKNKTEISIPPGDTAQIRELRKTLKQALASMGRLEGTYAPRQRDPGDYAVLASKKTASGKIRTYRNHRVSYFAANRLARRLEREGWDVKDVEDVRKQPEDVYRNIKTISVANALDEAARTMSQRKDLNADLAISFREDLIEQMANEIKARGFRASMIHRKAEGAVEGYNDDPLERMLIWMNSLSSGLAKAHVSELATRAMLGEFKDGKRVGGIDSAAEKRVYSVATKYLTEQLRNTETSDRLIGLAKSITTFKYLGFNARSVTVNLTAMVTTVPAAMHQALESKTSFVKIGKEIGSAGKDYAKFMAGKPFRNAKDQAFAEQVRKLGWDDPQYTREALSNLSNSHERIWTKMMDASMYVFGKAEQWNRGSTMLATYRLAVKQGHNETDAADMAKGASDSAHATYGKATYPIWAQDTNVFAKGSQLFYMYGKFGHNYVQLCYDLGMRKHNVKAFAWAALSPVVLAGGMVLPFKDEMFWFFGGILRALGVDRDPEKWWWDSVRRYLGNKGELVARHGVTGLMGGDISGSLSIGVGVPQGLLDLVGAPGGVAKDIWQAGKFVTTQQYGRAAEKILPRGFENIARAIRERETGLVTQRGQRKWTVEDRAYQPSGFETGLRAAGFRSTKQAVLAEREWEAKKEERVYNKRKSEIYEMYRAYLMRPKPDKHKKIRKLVNKFNADIKGKNVARITFESMKRQARRMRKPTKRQAERLQ